MDDKQLEKEIEALANAREMLTKDKASSDEVVQVFGIVLEIIKSIKDKINQEMADDKTEMTDTHQKMLSDMNSSMTDMESRMKTMCKEMVDKQGVDIEQVITQLSKEIKSVKGLIPKIPSFDPLWNRINEIEAKIPQIPEKDTPIEIRDGLEKLKGDERLDKTAIKGIEDLEKKIEEKTGNTTRRGWGAHPLTVKGFGLVVDKNTRIIDFVGTGLTSVVRSKDGIVTVTMNGGGGGGSTNVATEKLNPTNSGSNITLNLTLLSHTFSTIQWVSKNGQVLDPSDSSFGWSRVGNTITVLNATDSDVFMVSYTF